MQHFFKPGTALRMRVPTANIFAAGLAVASLSPDRHGISPSGSSRARLPCRRPEGARGPALSGKESRFISNLTKLWARSSCAVLPLLVGAAHCSPAHADTALPPIPVQADDTAGYPLDTSTINKSQAAAQSILGASDSAGLLSGLPGVGLMTNGGISSLPIVHGLADDQNATVVDGVPITSSCPNHMNPALSYIAPSQVGKMTVTAGISPVSAGGDTIGTVIAVDPAKPIFAGASEAFAAHGSVGTFYRSNNREVGLDGDVTAATQDFSLGYSGSWERARDYHDGDGDRILASSFENQNHAGTLAARNDDGELVLRFGHSITPYEGFPNAPMDMVGNTSNYVNLTYNGSFGWGNLQAKVYWQNVRHEMNLFDERVIYMDMPMNTNGTDEGYALKADVFLDMADILRLGSEYHGYRLNDWWPSTGADNEEYTNFINLNEGTRNILGHYAELERKWDRQWTSVVGVRDDIVWMNTGNVQGFGNNGSEWDPDDPAAAAAFNAQSHAKTDNNVSLTATLRYDATATNSDEIGLARKSQSPNLYERYAWSQDGASMINWFGNGLGYIGNLNLKPQTANTVSATTDWHDAAKADWDIKLTPYYTYIEKYINVNNLGFNPNAGVDVLQFANHDAQMYGFDLSGRKQLAKDTLAGNFDVSGTAGWVKGMQIDNGNSLYHMQPLNADVRLNQYLGGWSSSLDLRLMDKKSITDPLQNEPITPGFAILNWRASYQWQNITVAIGVDNIFNKQYYDPNGGVYVSGGEYSLPLPAMGRSFNAGVKVTF